ncbi:MAG: GNAT family acetyltransferase [Candidatus Bathyarchaeia archaeon]
MSFEIVRYRSEYQDAIVDLWRECHLIAPQNDPVEDIQKKHDFQPGLFFVALLDEKVIGSVMVGYEGHRGWLNYLAVLPDYQKRGYGRKLVEQAIHELKKLGCLKVNLQIRRSNISAVEFYKRLEFTEDDVVSLGKKLR